MWKLEFVIVDIWQTGKQGCNRHIYNITGQFANIISSPNPLNTTSLGNFAGLITELKKAPVETLVAQCESYIMGYNLKQEAKQPMINLH
jgi:hypothetical protein